MLAAALERERKNIYNDGFAKGQEVGLQIAQRQTILQLLQFRFNLTPEEQVRVAEQLEKIQTLETLSQLVNSLLNKEVQLEEFMKQLTANRLIHKAT